jgi:pantetheine-phosphate adenylyltransferase
MTAVYPGSFDPITNGHLDIIERAATRLDRVVVLCSRNPAKEPMFDVEERLELIGEAVGHLGNVEIASFDGLLVDWCNRRGIELAVKGLRAVSDFEAELQMAQMNAHLGGVETLFMTTRPVYSYLSSSLVKEVARFGGDISDLVPPAVARRLAA